ncbi:iron dicitrate transport regulator FecR [Dickeya dadantii]|nr:FecR domain-containing protein [Dickeya dadantii]NAT79026.1 iron dicitrate transport regulator FecR [Dickeya dadantii]
MHDEACSERERRAWRSWLESDDRHQLAWRQVEQIQARFQTPDNRLISSVLSRQGRERRSALKLLVLAGLTGTVGYSLPWRSYAADYRTGVGERRQLTLAQGVQVWLNTDSALNVRHQNDELVLQLLSGELLLEREDGENTPLWLETGQGRVMPASVCKLSLRTWEQRSCLAVFGGEAYLQLAAGADRRLRLPAGQEVTYSREQWQPPVAVLTFRQSWSSGVLVADNMRLDQLIGEIARYQRLHFQLDDDVAALRISGVFPLQDTERLFNALTKTLPITLSHRFHWWVTIRPRQA